MPPRRLLALQLGSALLWDKVWEPENHKEDLSLTRSQQKILHKSGIMWSKQINLGFVWNLRASWIIYSNSWWAFAYTLGCNYSNMCMDISLKQSRRPQCKVQPNHTKVLKFYFLYVTAAKVDFFCPFKSDSSHSFFCIFSIDQRPVWNFIASLLIAFLHFISFRDNFWPDVQRELFSWKGAHQTRIQINLSGHVWPTHYWRLDLKKKKKSGSGLRWLTRQLKPLWRDLGSRPRQRWMAIPVQRPPKVIHHQEFSFLLLKCGLRVVLEAAEMIRIWPDWTVWASVLGHCYHQLLLSFIDLAGRE